MRTCATCGQRFSGEATFCPFDGTKLGGPPDTMLDLAPGAKPASVARPHAVEDVGVGSLIGDAYLVERVLGEGGMGVVYAVTHVRLNKRFALKLLKRELAKDPETRERFLREAQAAGQIRHPNVVEITDYASLPDGSAYLVMEYLEGQPLSSMIKLGGALPALRAASLVRDVAGALGAAHALGIVHRDLKPDNVFVLQHGGREIAKILDFGVAKVAGSAKLTRTGMVFGTPHYMSPEQASGGVIDGRTDVYALGVIMYEMFTGRVPFEADTYMGVLTKHMFEAPVPPSQLAGAARELGALEDLTLRALAKRPEDRYATMADLVADLDRIIQVGPDGRAHVVAHLEGIQRPEVRGQPAHVRRSVIDLAYEREPPARAELTAAWANERDRRVRRVGVGVLVAALVLGVVAAAVVTLRPRPSAHEAPRPEQPPVAATAAPVPSSHLVVEPSALPTSEPVASTTAAASATVEVSKPPTTAPPAKTAKPAKKPAQSGEVEDPWAK
jgi:tRNA A-37 threonylcarbamoyl transferase component Bud32